MWYEHPLLELHGAEGWKATIGTNVSITYGLSMIYPTIMGTHASVLPLGVISINAPTTSRPMVASTISNKWRMSFSKVLE